MFLEISQNSQENTCASVSFLIKLQAFCEFCEISKNTFFTEHLWTTASVVSKILKIIEITQFLPYRFREIKHAYQHTKFCYFCNFFLDYAFFTNFCYFAILENAFMRVLPGIRDIIVLNLPKTFKLITRIKDIKHIDIFLCRSSRQRCSVKKIFLKIGKFTAKYQCQCLFFIKVADLGLQLY